MVKRLRLDPQETSPNPRRETLTADDHQNGMKFISSR